MRVVFVSPQSIRPLADRESAAPLEPPAGLLTLAAAIRHLAEPIIIDSQLKRLSPEETARSALDHRPDIVGISVNFVSLLRNAELIARAIRMESPEVPIVFGGNYATFFSEQLIKRKWIDVIILNEADLSFPDLVARYQKTGRLEPVSGSLTKADGRVHKSSFTGYVQDLDSLPFAAYDLLECRDRYVTSLITSRGCPYDCMYCSTKVMWHEWRGRSARNVLAEIDELMPTLPSRRIKFCDDLFTVRKKRVYELCDGLVARGVPVAWGMSARVETVDDEMLERLGEAGCRHIFFGFESGSDRVLKLMNRHYTAAEIERIVDRCIDARIIPLASFMVGMPGETREDVAKTFALMERINTPFVIMNLFTPFAGTPVYREPEAHGVTLFDDAGGPEGQLDNGMVFHRTEGLSAEEIKELWIEGTGIVAGRVRERYAYESVHASPVAGGGT